MKKIILVLIVLFLHSSLFAYKVKISEDYVGICNLDYPYTPFWSQYDTEYHFTTTDYTSHPYCAVHPYSEKIIKYQIVSECPVNTVPNSNGICETPPAPQTCSWATTPPYYASGLSQVSCSNVHKTGLTGDLYYKWNFSWCAADNTCYGRRYYCPVGQIFDLSTESCRAPKDPYMTDCANCGYYKVSGSVQTNNLKSCFIDYICKCNPKIRHRTDVSCSSAPVDSNYPETNPDAPTLPTNESTKPASSSENTGNCFAAESSARLNCLRPNVLSFQCDPTTGKVLKNECKAPTVPEQTQKNAGDSTNAATTEDIKDLGNNLPKSIKEALSDFFTDGSMPHLEAIRGQMQASNILDADRNDKLDTMSASIDAGLVLQTDANEKLDGIKTSTDGVKSSVDSLKSSVDAEKSVLDRIAEFFNDTSTYNGESVPTDSDISPDSNTTNGFDTFTNSITQTKDQFDQALNVMGGGVPNIVFRSGSCPSYTFMGHNVSLSSIGQSISPYSSIFSILIYISLMITAFRLVFGFFSKGV